MSRRARSLLWFIAAVAVVFAVGYYRKEIQDGESVHFALNYPAQGKELGGLGATGADGRLWVNVDHTGLVKRLVQPNVVNLSTHWLKNVGDKPRRIRLAAEGIPYPVRWESTEKTWSEGDHSIGRTLAPGSTVTVDWFITLPRPLPDKPVLLDGALVVYDADTSEKLSALPVRIVRSSGTSAGGGDCCAPK